MRLDAIIPRAVVSLLLLGCAIPSFAQTEFLDAVRTGKTLDAHDALRTHELCEEVVRRIEAQA